MKRTILCIETSTDVCSAAVCAVDDSVAGGTSELVSYRLSEAGSNHARLLPLYLDELIGKVREKCLHIDCVAVSSGPGSYTGLRIGVSTAKGLAYGWNVPLVAVPTLEVLCESVLRKENVKSGSLLCPMIDARRMEVYTALYDRSLKEVMGIRPQVVEDCRWLPDDEILYFGNGAEKCSSILNTGNLHFISGIKADARVMGRLAAKYMNEGKTADVAYFEPFYLKEFVAAPSHIKGL